MASVIASSTSPNVVLSNSSDGDRSANVASLLITPAREASASVWHSAQIPVGSSMTDGNEPIGNEPSGELIKSNEPNGNEPSGVPLTSNEPIGNEPIGKKDTSNEPIGNEPSGEAAMVPYSSATSTRDDVPDKEGVLEQSGVPSIAWQPSKSSRISRDSGGLPRVSKLNDPIGKEPIGKEPIGKDPSGVLPRLVAPLLDNACSTSASVVLAGLRPSRVQVSDSSAGVCSSKNSQNDLPSISNEPIGNEPIGNEPRGKEPIGAASKLKDPSGNEPIGNDPIGNEPIGNEPIGNEPMGNEPNGNEPIGNEPNGKEPMGKPPTWNDPNGNDDSDNAETGAPLICRPNSVSSSLQLVNDESAAIRVSQISSDSGSAFNAQSSSSSTLISPIDTPGSENEPSGEP